MRRFLFFLFSAFLCSLAGLTSAQAVSQFNSASVDLSFALRNTEVHQEKVSLPYNWDRKNGAVDGQARFGIDFLVSDTKRLLGIYLPRIGNTFEIKLNGQVLAKVGVPGEPHQNFAKHPFFFAIPLDMLRSSNHLEITIQVIGGHYGGLSPVYIGEVEAVRAQFKSGYFWLHTGYFIVSIVSAVLALLSLLLWLKQREMVYAYYGLGELLFAFRMSDARFEISPLPWPWWELIIFSAQGLGSILLLKFALSIMNLHQGRIKMIMNAYMVLTIPVVALTLFCGWPLLSNLWVSLGSVFAVWVTCIIVPRGLRSRITEQKLLAFSFMAIALAATRDAVAFQVFAIFTGTVWTVYAWLGFGMTLAWIIAERLHTSSVQVAQMNQELSTRLHQREQQLHQIFSQQSQVDQQQTILEERQRLTRDMHDGLGSQLLSALTLAQDPNSQRDELVSQLRETMDQLKLTVDAMHDTEGDIAALLGALRYRLGKRLQSAGIKLHWLVADLPRFDSWTLRDSRQLQMILYEALSNLMVHARATEARLQAEYDETQQCVLIRLSDNGKGFDVAMASAQTGHGLANMQQRCKLLGATLAIDSSEDGTTLSLSLPIIRKA